MIGTQSVWRRLAPFIGGTALFFAVPGLLRADNSLPEPQMKANESNAAETSTVHVNSIPAHLGHVPILDLPACKSIALAKQPAITAANGSYHAAVARQQALETVRVLKCLAPDLPVRKSQAAIGVQIARYEVQRAQIDALYSVTFAYLSAQYAAEQRALVEAARARLLELEEPVKLAIAAKKGIAGPEDLARIQMTLRNLDARKCETEVGEQRAMSALREAMGVDRTTPLILRASGQFRLQPDLNKEVLINLAQTRRPEIHQATLLTQVHGLEVDAQAMKSLLPTMRTFASGSDIHSRPLPAGSYSEEYSPAAIGPEMPVDLNGDCTARPEVAKAYHQRAGTVLQKTSNLIALETEQAYLRYLEAQKKLPLLIEAHKQARMVFDATLKQLKELDRFTRVRDLLAVGAQVTEFQSQVNQTRYQLVVSLARIERATAFGFCASFELAPTSDPVTEPEPDATDKQDEEVLPPPREHPGQPKMEKND